MFGKLALVFGFNHEGTEGHRNFRGIPSCCDQLTHKIMGQIQPVDPSYQYGRQAFALFKFQGRFP